MQKHATAQEPAIATNVATGLLVALVLRSQDGSQLTGSKDHRRRPSEASVAPLGGGLGH